MKSYAIIGLGLFGTQLAKELYDDGNSVLAIDINERLIEDISDDVSRAVCVDAKDRNALSQLGISKYDCVIVALSGDLATSVLVTMNLKALNAKKIICKVKNDADREVLETLGASSCIIPEHIAATNLSKKLTGKNVLEFIQLSENYSIIEMATPACWVGKNIISLNIRSKYGVNVIGIRNSGTISVDFDPTEELKETDELIIIGNNLQIDRLQKLS